MVDKELAKLLREECICRAAAEIGSERRFFQALANMLEDILKHGENESRSFIDKLADVFGGKQNENR